MGNVWLEGVVRNGQVVLAAPLDLPDGTTVVVTDCYEMEDDPRPPESSAPPSPEAVKDLILAMARRPDLTDDPDWEAKIRGRCG